MAFNPSSTIYLCNVPIDSTYKHQIYFGNRTAQRNYFAECIRFTFTNYLTVRKTQPDGSLQSSVRVDANIDSLYGCNYMYYQNTNHGSRWFYAFITKLIYINEGTTEIVFETDVYQTWMLDCTVLPSYVEREHSVTDEPGDHLVLEKFNFEDFNYTEVFPKEPFNKFPSGYGYLIGTSNFVQVEGDENEFRGSYQNGIYQGMYFYYFKDGVGVSSFIQTAEREQGDCVQFVCCIPEFCVKNANFEDDLDYGIMHSTSSPSESYVSFTPFSERNIDFQGYKPKNKKLYTSPYCNFMITNNSGQEVIYNLEDFGSYGDVAFYMYGDISINPSITLIPWYYKGTGENINFGISLSNFPQCSFNSDSFKLWLAKNQYGTALDFVSSIGQIAVGGAMLGGLIATGGVSGLIGGGTIMSGVTGFLNTTQGFYQASREPNRTTGGAPKNNLLTALKKNTFQAYIRTIKEHHAKTVDDFFTMYGYQTNTIKVPNMNSRPYWNYVKTVDINIEGDVCDQDMKILKNIFDKGVTLWKPNTMVGNYVYDNSPE